MYHQLSAPAFTANFTGNYRPVYGPGTKLALSLKQKQTGRFKADSRYVGVATDP